MESVILHTILFGISGGEILIILLMVLLLFGPSKIPEIARLLGRGINEVKKVQREINTEIQRYSAEVEKEARKIQTDFNDIKKEIHKSVETEKDTQGDGQRQKAYDYDQYGLDETYARTYGESRNYEQPAEELSQPPQDTDTAPEITEGSPPESATEERKPETTKSRTKKAVRKPKEK